MSLHLILTGGTIDKFYNELGGELAFSESHVHDMLRQARVTDTPAIEIVMMKDSLEMTDEDRAKIAGACVAAPASRIIITHGTDTMSETARFLKNIPELSSKTIVLTGAMVPYSFGIKSDALFNLGMAFAFAQSLTPGIYIAMNGRAFSGGNVRKNKSLGVFSAIE